MTRRIALTARNRTVAVEAMHRRGAGAHLVLRMKAGVRLPVVPRLGDGDYLSGGLYWRRRRGCTVRDPNAELAGDLVNRQFTATGPIQLWVTDITEHPTDEGNVYCAALLVHRGQYAQGASSRRARNGGVAARPGRRR